MLKCMNRRFSMTSNLHFSNQFYNWQFPQIEFFIKQNQVLQNIRKTQIRWQASKKIAMLSVKQKRLCVESGYQPLKSTSQFQTILIFVLSALNLFEKKQTVNVGVKIHNQGFSDSTTVAKNVFDIFAPQQCFVENPNRRGMGLGVELWELINKKTNFSLQIESR